MEQRMDIPSLCLLMSATLSIHPDRSQFYRYETLTLNCAVSGNFSGWTLRRNTSSGTFLSSEDGWCRQNGSSCINPSTFTSDNGVFWCESDEGCRSNVLSITVNVGVVIVEIPARPVAEGDRVTVRCSHKERYVKTAVSDFNASFYRNGVFMGIHPEGTMTIPAVSESDEGFYTCKHPTKGASLQSFLAVTVGAQPRDVLPTARPGMYLPRLVCSVLLFIFYTVIMIVCVIRYRQWARARADAERRVWDRVIAD
ncbi:putative Fc receptor-like protein 5-like isoform 2 [Scophthalmus maximus]|uniref:Putative Fc receptor-like protein 5-like isoform 2 n=1 Tax=Scophthalmus maximus TaxID=52904 RepID=A0A2U9B019_SCOMX|nr:uncharacterized protein LOC118285097 [Scophthalmus maximus]AWO97272.1 putative Fc receptor-like protein 5-like isoform 2 [Scophthalmus maximus]